MVLPSVQKKVVLNLAENKPQTIHETKEKIQGHYKSVHNAFQSLIKKDAIKAVGTKDYRERQFDTYWLTDYGVFLAITHGADLKLLQERVERIYGKTDDYGLLFDWVRAFPRKLPKFIHQAFEAQNGKLSLKHIPIRTREMRKALKIMANYPSYRPALKKLKHAISDLFDELESSEEE